MQREISQLTGSASILQTNYAVINLACGETGHPVSLRNNPKCLKCAELSHVTLGPGDNKITGQYGQYGVMTY